MRFSYASGQGSLGPRLRSGFWKLLPSLCFRASAGRRTQWGFPPGGRGGRADSGGRRSPQRRSRTGVSQGRHRYLGPLPNRWAASCTEKCRRDSLTRGGDIHTGGASLLSNAFITRYVGAVHNFSHNCIKSDWFNFLISFMVNVKYRYITLRARKSNLWRGESVAETHHHNHKFRFLDYILTTILWMIMKINH